METPPPVNLNNPHLMALLSKSKNIMQKAEEKAPIVLSETTVRLSAAEAANEPEISIPLEPRAPNGYTREQVLASKLPEAIKESMLKSIPATVINEDMSDLDDIKMIPNKRNPITKKVVNETINTKNTDLITVSRGELKEMINESLIKFLTESYNKTITEATIKKTIQTLINEGKLKINKK